MPFPKERIAARFNTDLTNYTASLRGVHIILGMTVLVMLPSYLMIPNVLAAGPCSSTSSDWTDPSLCGHGSMIAIIVTTHDSNLETKLAAFDAQNGLPSCTVQNGCLEIATPYGPSNPNPASNSDMSPFVAAAHKSSPGAKILVVEAKSTSWQDKYDAANYAITQPDVVKVSSVSYSKVVMIIGLVLK